MYTNLGKETREFLADKPEVEGVYFYSRNEKGGEDLLKRNKTTLEQFLEVADKVDYDSGFGCQEINPFLVIRFVDGSVAHRHEYDGAEYWDYDCAPNNAVEKEFTLKDAYEDEERYYRATFGPDSKEYEEWEKRYYGDDED